MTTVTPDQVRTLWNTCTPIDRGEDLAPVTRDDLTALMAGDVDTDENGTPTDEMWEVLADQLNDTADQLDDPQERALDHLRETMAARDAEHERAAAIIAAADGEIRADVLACIDAHIPVPTIGEVLGVTRARIYQIRDGRR